LATVQLPNVTSLTSISLLAALKDVLGENQGLLKLVGTQVSDGANDELQPLFCRERRHNGQSRVHVTKSTFICDNPMLISSLHIAGGHKSGINELRMNRSGENAIDAIVTSV
jgi:hypothetical protein